MRVPYKHQLKDWYWFIRESDIIEWMNKYKVGLGDERFSFWRWFGEIMLTLLSVYAIQLFISLLY